MIIKILTRIRDDIFTFVTPLYIIILIVEIIYVKNNSLLR